MRKVQIFIGVACASVFLSGCGLIGGVTEDHVFRSGEPESTACLNVSMNPQTGADWIRSTESDGPEPRHPCMLETQVIPGAAEAWGMYPRTTELHHHSFDLAFIEMLDDPNQGLDEAQIEALRARLGSGDSQKVVLMFVHGWRNNASWGNGDVASFRTTLAYTRSFLNTRCVTENRYCNAELIGVYLGWRGASLYETGVLGQIPSLLTTFGSRKRQSEEHGNGRMHQVIDLIHSQLDLNVNSVSSDKFMLVGHSLGANMLITGLGEQYEDAASRYTAGSSRPFVPLGENGALIAGDLVVLLNPAAEAYKWNEIQRAERSAAGFTSDDQNPAYFVEGDPHVAASLVWRRQYPITQRPSLISITATADWSEVEDLDGNPESDRTTGIVFRGFNWLQEPNLPFVRRERRAAIGHLQPRYTQGADRYRRLAPGAPALGASHDITTISGVCATGTVCQIGDVRTGMQNAGNPRTAWCEPADGGLLAARQTAEDNHGSYPQHWDWRPDVGGVQNHARMQFRQQLALNDGRLFFSSQDRMYSSMAPPSTPFWAMRAPDNTIFSHGSIYSYPMWCGLTQIWLDPITARN